MYLMSIRHHAQKDRCPLVRHRFGPEFIAGIWIYDLPTVQFLTEIVYLHVIEKLPVLAMLFRTEVGGKRT